MLDHAECTAVCRETVQHCAVRQLQLQTGCQQVDVGRGSPPGLRRQVTTLLVYGTSTFVHLTISPESPAQGEESNGAEAEVQAAAVVLHRGLGSPIDCPSQLSWTSWKGILPDLWVMAMVIHGFRLQFRRPPTFSGVKVTSEKGPQKSRTSCL